MIEVGFIYPGADPGILDFSVLPYIVLRRDENEMSKTIEFMWLFWGFHITVYHENQTA